MIYLFIRNFVTSPLDKMVSGLRDISSGEGDLTRRLDIRSKDEIGILAASFSRMRASVVQAMRMLDS